MAMTLGSVLVNQSTGAVSGTGSTRALFDLLMTHLGNAIPAGAEGVAAKQAFASTARAIAEWNYTLLTVDAALRIRPSDAGMQRADVGGTPGQPTLAPSGNFTGGKIV